LRPHFEWHKVVAFPRQHYFQSFGPKQGPKFSRNVESIIFFVAIAAGGAFVVTAMSGIENDCLQSANARDHVRAHLRLDGLGQVHARNQILSAVFDHGKTEPVARAIDIDLAAIEVELEQAFFVLEPDLSPEWRDSRRETVKLCDVIDAQIIVRADFDNLPGIGRLRSAGNASDRGGGRQPNSQEPLDLHQSHSGKVITRARKIDHTSTLDNRRCSRLQVAAVATMNGREGNCLCQNWDDEIPRPGQDTVAAFLLSAVKSQDNSGFFEQWFCGITASKVPI